MDRLVTMKRGGVVLQKTVDNARKPPGTEPDASFFSERAVGTGPPDAVVLLNRIHACLPDV